VTSAANRFSIVANVVAIVFVAIILVAPLVTNNFWLFFLTQMVIGSYVATSFNITYSYGKVLSFAQGSFFGIGAYVGLYLAASHAWSLPLIILVAILACGVFGALFGAILVRMGGHNPTIATVILASAGLLAANALGYYTGSEDGLSLTLDSVGFAGLDVGLGPTVAVYYVAAIPLAMIVTFLLWAQNKDFWKITRAIASNELRAQQLGYDVKTRKVVVFSGSAAIAGIGGAFYVLLMKHVGSSVFDIGLSVNAILYAVVGGVGTVVGPILGVFIIYPLTELIARHFLYVQIVIGIVLVVTAIAMPRGILAALYSRLRG
jgi:branched-chain amino acid transport system permease protein